MAIPVGTAVGYLDLDYSKFSNKLNTAVTEANGLSNKFADTIGSGLTTIGDKISTVGSKLTTSISVPLGLAMASAVKFGAEFDKKMSNVKAVSGATAEEFATMRDAAIDWGEKTVYTASEASDALYYMGLAGWDANNSVKALGPVLNLAAAGNLELGRTSDIVTDAMTALGLEADEYTNGIANAEHFTNVLAATMANSNTDVDQLGEAFKYVAPLAGAAKIESEDLSLALGMMANVGVKASQAGTGLRQALKSVISPTDKAAGYMKEYGVSLFDAEGNTKSMKQFMDELRETFGDLAVDVYDANGELKTAEQIMEEYGHSLPTSQQEKLNAIVQIFGTRALPGVLGIIEQTDEKYNDLANSIYSSDKAFVKFGDEFMTYQEAVDKYGETLVNTSGDFEILGYSAGMAEIQMDNLQGDWIKFTSALGTTKIEITDLVNGALRQFVQKLTELVKWFNDLDDEQQKHILKIAGMVAAIGPALLVFGKLVSGIGRTITAFSTIANAMTKLKIGFKMFGASIGRVSEGFKIAKTATAALGAEVSPLGAALASISLPVVAAVAAVVALTAAFVHLMKTNDEFRGKIIGIWDGIKAKFSEAGKKMTDVINKLGFDFSSLTEAIKAGFDWFANALAPFFIAWAEGVSKTIGSIIDIVTGLFQVIGGLIIGFRDGDWSTFVEGIKGFVGGLFDLFTMPIQAIFMVITEYLTAFGTSWSEIWQGIKDFFFGIWDGIVEFVLGIVDGIVGAWEGLKSRVVQFIIDLKTSLEEVWNGIKEGTVSIAIDIRDSVIDAWNTLKTRVIEFVEYLREQLTQLWDNIKNTVKTTVTSLKEIVVNLFNEMKTRVVNIVTNIKNTAISLFNVMKSTVVDTVTAMKNTVINIFTTMKTSIIQKVTEIKDGIIKVFDGIKEKFIEIGGNIVNGIWEGINAGWDWLTNKVKDLAKSLLDAAKSALGINSPSREFRKEVGRWIPPGIVEGVEDAMPEAVKDIQDTIDEGMSQIDADVNVGNPLLDIIDTTQQAIDNVADWFVSIEQKLSNVVSDMKSDLMNLIELGQITINPDGTLSGLTYDRPSQSIKTPEGTGETNENVVNNFYYTFNSPKAIDELDAARKFKETQRDLAEGF